MEDEAHTSPQFDSDCESTLTSSLPPLLFPESLALSLPVADKSHVLIRRRFLSCFGDRTATVVAIHRKNWSGFSNQARLLTFRIHSKAVADKNGGDAANVKLAWYGNHREGIDRVLEYGFSHTEVEGNNNGAVFLSPDDSPANSVERAIPDEDGVRHVLLCRVILGRPEFIQSGSGQTHPSSDEFDSGIEKGKEYIIWSTQMNTHIVPEFVVSFRGSASMAKPPTSPWIPFPVLISALRKFLAQDALALINKYYNELKAKKITREELVRKMRVIVGDKLLRAIIKLYYPRGPRSKIVPLGLLGNKTNNK